MTAGVPEQADVVVVGGGIMGMSTAYHLAQDTNLDVLLLEKDSIGSGSTGASSGIIRFHYGDARVYSEMAGRSYQFWVNAEEMLGTDVGFTNNGIIYFGCDDADHGEMAGCEIVDDMGFDIDRLDADECHDIVPHVSIEDYDFGLYSRDAGFADPHAANMAFYEKAVELGANVETGVTVTGFLTENSGKCVTGVTTADGEISAEAVVSAAGPWSKKLAQSVDIDLPIVPTREQILILSPEDAFFEEYLYPFPTVSSKGPGHVYFRPMPVDNVLVGGHHYGEECNPDRYKEDADHDYINWAIGKIQQRAPPLTESDLVQGYSGIYSNTPDKDFIIDKPVDNLVVLAGFSGHGFKHSPTVGSIAADLVTKGRTDIVDLDRFSLSRFDGATPKHRKSL